MASVFDDKSDTAVPSEVDGCLDMLYSRGIDDIDWIPTLRVEPHVLLVDF